MYKPKQKTEKEDRTRTTQPNVIPISQEFKTLHFQKYWYDRSIFWQLIGWTICSKDKKSLTIHFRFWYKNNIFVPKLVFIVRNIIWSLGSVYYSTIQISFSDLKKEIGNHSVISNFHFQFENENKKIGSIFWFSFIIWNWKSENWTYFLIFILQSLKRNEK